LTDNNSHNENSQQTPLSKRAEILGELWVKHKNNLEFQDFISYNDLGLPLAYSLSTEIIKATPKVEMFINETWDILMSALDHNDIGWNSLDELLDGDYPDMGLLNDE
jgi:hypothetical protein